MATVLRAFHQRGQSASELATTIFPHRDPQPHTAHGTRALHCDDIIPVFVLTDAVQILAQATTSSFPVGMASVVYNDTPMAPGISQDLILTVDPSKVRLHT